MTLIDFLVRHAEVVIPTCALLAFLSWRIVRAERILAEIDAAMLRHPAGKAVSPDLEAWWRL